MHIMSTIMTNTHPKNPLQVFFKTCNKNSRYSQIMKNTSFAKPNNQRMQFHISTPCPNLHFISLKLDKNSKFIVPTEKQKHAYILANTQIWIIIIIPKFKHETCNCSFRAEKGGVQEY